MNSICIVNQPLLLKEWQGKRVVTFKDVDIVHQRPEGTARRNFGTNKKRFVKGEDYYEISPDEIRKNKVMPISEAVRSSMILLTEMGYLMLVKSFTDDLAWQVQRSLVQNYFRGKEDTTAPNPKPKHQESKEVCKKPVRKFFGGRPVMTLKDLAYLMSVSKATMVYYLQLHGIAGVKLEGKYLRDFKCENRQINTINSLLIFEEAHVEWLLRQLGQFEEHKAFFNEYFALDYNANLSREEMYLAVKQASLLFDTAREIKDPHAKAQALKAVTVILINIGLWDDRQHGYNGVTSEWSINSTEGWNKVDVLRKAKKQFLP